MSRPVSTLRVSARDGHKLSHSNTSPLVIRVKKLLDRGNPEQAARSSDQHLVRHDDPLLSCCVHSILYNNPLVKPPAFRISLARSVMQVALKECGSKRR